MKIERNTKVQQGSGVLTTSIPQTISEIMGIERGTPLIWTLTDEGKVIVQKEVIITRIDFTINIHKADTDDVGETIRFFFTFNDEGDIDDWKSFNPLKGSEVDYLHFCDGWSSDDPSLVESLVRFLQRCDIWIVDRVVTNDPRDIGERYETVFEDCLVTVEIVDIVS
jgi:hypothetical protein